MTVDTRSVTLERRLGAGDAAAIIISNVIGSGIFFTPAIVADLLPNPWWMLSAWLAGGALALAGAASYAELATLRPRAGGEYVYIGDAFGKAAGFLTGWTSFVAGFSGAIAASAVGFASYLGRFIPAAGDATPLASLSLGLVDLEISPRAIVALVTIAGLSTIHLMGLGPGRMVQNLLAGLKVTVLAAFVALGFALGHGSVANFRTGVGEISVTNWLLALTPVMFTYSGWNAAAYVAEEVRNPERNLPRALAFGTVAVIGIYLALNLLYLYALSVPEFVGLQVRVVDAVAERLFGAIAANLLAAMALVIVAGSISAMVFAGPRVYYAMARDGLFLQGAGDVHPRFKTPAFSIAAQGVWSGLLVLSGTFEQLVNYTGFAIVLFSGIAVASLFVLRRGDRSEPRPFRTWGYPFVPAVFAIMSLLMVVNEIMRVPQDALAGLGVILAGLPLYFVMRAVYHR